MTYGERLSLVNKASVIRRWQAVFARNGWEWPS